jgi:hypothetical protein
MEEENKERASASETRVCLKLVSRDRVTTFESPPERTSQMLKRHLARCNLEMLNSAVNRRDIPKWPCAMLTSGSILLDNDMSLLPQTFLTKNLLKYLEFFSSAKRNFSKINEILEKTEEYKRGLLIS